MSDPRLHADTVRENREALGGVGMTGVPDASAGVALRADIAVVGAPDVDLAYDSGVEVKARSQWAYVRMRFLRHKLAVVSLIVLILIALVGVFAPQIAPYAYDELDLENTTQSPTLEGWHLFGTDQLGRDYLSRVIYGVRTSLWVAVMVALLATAIGTAVGAVAGYYSGQVDNLLMRFTDLILTLPGLAVLLTAAVFFGSGDPFRIGTPSWCSSSSGPASRASCAVSFSR